MERELAHTLNYLKSDAAFRSIEEDPYWPKWDSPWWHMLLLHEMGLTAEIPENLVAAYAARVNRVPVKIFPIRPGELPEGLSPYSDSLCHCQVGNMYQVLAARGVDVDVEIPWLRPFCLGYQMPDGGMNCDESAYLAENECPSSMVGTIAVFEAILLHTPRDWTEKERQFLNRAADFLIKRELRLGSTAKHNVAEQTSATLWTKLCFPRFYFYDVLRGLNALTIWAQKTGHELPAPSIEFVVNHLQQEFPDGQVKIGRRAFEGVTTRIRGPTGDWQRRQPASLFPLLELVSRIGAESPYLSRQWGQLTSLNPRLQAET